MLADEGTDVVGFDVGDDPARLQLVMGPDALERVKLVRGDIADFAQVDRAIEEHGITHVIHLAALQVPFCRADPVRGARVNVVGTVCVFEAVKQRELGTPIAYASSAAVYDRSGAMAPTTIYGVYKAANEDTARIYWEECGVPSVGLRPFCVYGPGRDQGLTAEPTHAMRAAAQGEPYLITFGGRTELHYAPDVARALVLAARSPGGSADVYDMPGEPVHMSEVVSAIEAAAPGADVTHGGRAAPVPGRAPRAAFFGSGDAARGRDRRDDRALPSLDAARHPCLSRPIEAAQQPVEESAGSGRPLGQPRGIGFGIFLFIITFSFYGWYWAYKTQEELKQHTGEGLGGVVGLVVWILLSAVTGYTIPSEIGNMYAKDGREKPMTGLTGLWYFPGLPLDHPRHRVVRKGAGRAESLLGVQGRDGVAAPERGGSFDGRTTPQSTYRAVALDRDARHLPAVLDLHHVRGGKVRIAARARAASWACCWR